MMTEYKVKKYLKDDIVAEVPGSKSITNRALLLAAMADGTSRLEGAAFSEDSVHFLNALKELGFTAQADEKKCSVVIEGHGGKIPNKNAKIYVGSAGTAARFLTAFTAMGDGEYILESSDQMKKRPMRELLVALESLGAEFTWLEDEYTFPMKVKGILYGRNSDINSAKKSEMNLNGVIADKVIEPKQVDLNIDRSSQFLSALLLVLPIAFDNVTIKMTGTRQARSYVEMTEQMMKQFGHTGIEKLAGDCYRVRGMKYTALNYNIEPDVSAACYFYALAAATGKRAMVKRMRKDSLQGDMKFIDLLEKMGCEVRWDKDKENNLWLKGPDGKLKGIEVKMSDFSDQALTLAAIAPFADSKVTITGISHIRGQESDRIKVIVDELTKMGISCNELTDGVEIYPGTPKNVEIETYNDHRVAMSFAVTGLAGDGMTILNPECCKKTFAGFFDEIDRLEE
jgi:3-phosphoshikimate 1-carboxyvinyltransferase